MKNMIQKLKNRCGSHSVPGHWRELHGRQRLRYLFDYYRLPLVLLCILLYIVFWLGWRQAHRKNHLLYVGLVNIAPPADLARALTDGYLKETVSAADPCADLYLYQNLFLSADEKSEYHPYTYASKMKILGAIDAERFDLVLMDQEAFGAFSQNGYLADLEPVFSAPEKPLRPELSSCLVRNICIEEDNAMELFLGTETEYHSRTRSGMFGLDLSKASPLIRSAKLSGRVYLGLIQNSPRKAQALDYINYLLK